MTLPPQVIRRGDAYALLNADPDSMTLVQRVALAATIWDQVRTLMEVNGEYRPRDPTISQSNGIGTTDDIDIIAAELTKAAKSSVNRIRPRLQSYPDVVEKMLNGEIALLHDAMLAVGMTDRMTLAEGKPSKAKLKNSYFGKGDKFREAMEPLARYLLAWEKRGFSFPHVPPKEAQKRLVKIDKMMGDLALVREDLLRRSHVATLKAPSEKKRKGDI